MQYSKEQVRIEIIRSHRKVSSLKIDIQEILEKYVLGEYSAGAIISISAPDFDSLLEKYKGIWEQKTNSPFEPQNVIHHNSVFGIVRLVREGA